MWVGLGIACVVSVGCDSKGAGSGSAKPAATSAAKSSGTAKSPATASPAAANQGPINGCTSFVDRTSVDAEHTIHWNESAAKSPARCMKIKAGQSVVWDGDFARYPVQVAGGTTPSPIAGFKDAISNPGVKGEERSLIEFMKPGTYGFVCPSKPEMKGAILVVP